MKRHIAAYSVLVVVASMIAVAVLLGGDSDAPTAIAGERPGRKVNSKETIDEISRLIPPPFVGMAYFNSKEVNS